MESNQRRRTRVKAAFTVELERQNVFVAAETVNISMKGILCNAVHGFAIGDKCEVHIILANKVRAVISGIVVRADAEGIAVDFQSMDDESFSHLRCIVQYNLGDADAIDKEITSSAFDS